MLTLERIPIEKAYILQNLYPLYLHDLSIYLDALPNAHGLFEDEEIATYDPQTFQMIWWQHPDQLFPYLIMMDDRPAGFALVSSKPYSGDSDYEMVEFFVLKPYRGKGIARQAAIRAFDLHHGQWKLAVLPKNSPARAFWRRTIAELASDFSEKLEEAHGDEMVIFRFGN